MTLHLHRWRWWPIVPPLPCSYLTARKDEIAYQILVCFQITQYSYVHQVYPYTVPNWNINLYLSATQGEAPEAENEDIDTETEADDIIPRTSGD